MQENVREGYKPFARRALHRIKALPIRLTRKPPFKQVVREGPCIHNLKAPARGAIGTPSGRAVRSAHYLRTQAVFHLMLQPIDGFCSLGTGLPASTASIAARKSFPVTGIPFPGRLSSYCPR